MTCFDLHAICPGRGDCAACAAYARDVVEPFNASTRTLPEPVAERLRTIGRPTVDPATELATEIVTQVAATPPPQRRMPEALRQQLRAIPRTATRDRRRQPPKWLAEGGWGLAACALLTTVLTLAAGDVSARFQNTTKAVEQTLDEVVERTDTVRSPWIQRLEEGVLEPIGSLGSSSLAQVRKARVATGEWLDRQLDDTLDEARTTAVTTWTWTREMTRASADQIAAWSDELITAASRLGDDSDSETAETNDNGTAPTTEPIDEGSLP